MPEPERATPLGMVADRLQAHTLGNPLTNSECWDLIRTITGYDRAHDALVAALKAMLNRYVRGVESGDWGNWDAETDDEVIQARAALAAAVK